MASFIYDKGRMEFAKGNIAWVAATTYLRCTLIDVADYNGATRKSLDEYYDEGGGTGPVAGAISPSAQEIDVESDPTAGICDAADQDFTAVENTGVTSLSALVIYKYDTGNTTSPLIAWVEFSQVVPNGSDITVQWDNTSSRKIFKL